MLLSSEHVIVPRQRVPKGAFPIYEFTTSIPAAWRAEEGRTLSRWRDERWGSIVADGKHNGHFGDDLVDAVIDLLTNRWQPAPQPVWLTSIPSHRHPHLVSDFAQRLADRLAIPFVPIIVKTGNNEEQKRQANSFYQCRNLDGVFTISGRPNPGPVLLIDDMVDSRWTFTVIAVLLRRAGSGPVFPFALASTTSGDT